MDPTTWGLMGSLPDGGGQLSRVEPRWVVAVALVFVAGCSGPQDAMPSHDSASLPAAVTPSTDVTPSGGSDATAEAEASSPDSVPSGSAPPSADTGQSVGELAWEDTPEGWLSWVAESRRIDDPPEVEVVRETRPEEIGELVAKCMQEQGFDAKAFPDGSWETSAGPGQGEAVAMAEYVCIAQYPLQPKFYQPYDDDKLRQSYDWHVNTTIPCLQDLGYTTPEPPSVEVYIETYRARGEQWMAQTAGDLPFETFDRCPPEPSAAELFPPDE